MENSKDLGKKKVSKEDLGVKPDKIGNENLEKIVGGLEEDRFKPLLKPINFLHFKCNRCGYDWYADVTKAEFMFMKCPQCGSMDLEYDVMPDDDH